MSSNSLEKEAVMSLLELPQNTPTADYVEALLSSGGSAWRKFSFPSLTLCPTPQYCLCYKSLISSRWRRLMSRHHWKGHQNAPNVSFIHSCFPCAHLFLVGEEGRSKHSLDWPPRLRNVCQTSLIHSSDNWARVHSDELTVVKAGQTVDMLVNAKLNRLFW